MSVEELNQLPSTPEELQGLPRPEEAPEAKVIAFEDQRGIERRPHPEAVECYASPEIQQVVGEHFLELDRRLDEVEAEIAEIGNPEKTNETSFRPLDDELLGLVKAKAKEQLPELTETRTETRTKEVTTGRFFKKTHTESEPVEVEHPVQGFVASATDRKRAEGWRWVHEQAGHEAAYMDMEHVPNLEKEAVEKMEELLVGDQKDIFDPGAKKRLPLLATKIRDAGLTAEQIDELDWEQIEALVPEAKPWFDDIHRLEVSIDDKVIKTDLVQVTDTLRRLSTLGYRTIATIYYDEPTLNRISDLYDEAMGRLAAMYELKNPGKEYNHKPRELYNQMIKDIASFFDNKPLADSLLMHGTTFIPRIIKSGALKPASGMDPEEYTFNTNRSHVRGRGVGINGSRATHFADHQNSSYGQDIEVTEEMVRANVSRTLGVPADHPWVDAEVAKGGLGASIIVMRLGDVVSHSPYGGYMDISSGSRGEKGDGQPKLGVVELTPTGWAKAEERLITRLGADIAYAAAPDTHSNEEMFDYEYPLDELLLGIPSRDPDTIPSALREIGWTDEQIAQHTFVFKKDVGEGRVLQDWAVRHPKYPNGVVVPISSERNN